MTKENKEDNKTENYFTKKHKIYPVAQTLKLVVAIAAIALFIDIQNYPSNLIDKFGAPTFGVAMVTLLAIAVITAYEDGLHKQLTLPFINRLDNLVALGFYLSVVCFFERQLLLGYDWPYKNAVAIITIICFICMIIRLARVTAVDEILKAEKQTQMVYDLKAIFDGSKIEPGRSLVIGEIDIDYDMLNRTKLINHLESLLLNSPTDERCVISLEGSWGAGKTTLVNNVKKKVKNNEKIIWIDDFDPWNYKNQEAMLNGFLETILHESKIHYRGDRFNKMSATISKLILKTDSNIIDDVFRKDVTVTEFKEQIESCLKAMDKKIVMVIDNLDRIDPEQIIFMFDLVGNILNFDCITYIMLYDKDKIKGIFDGELGRDGNYIDKIVNVPLKIPKIDTKRLKDIYKKVLKNILNAYDAEQNISDYEALIETMINVGIDFRQYKQFINSGVIPYLNKEFYLNKTDMINLEFIKQFNFELYEDIYRHKEYFTCYGENHYDFQWHDKNMFLEHLEKYYKDISQKHNKYTLLIEQLSPYMQFNPDYSIDICTISNETKINIEMKLSDWDKFDLYFTFSENEQVEDSHKVREFIKRFNSEVDNENRNKLFKEFIVIENTKKQRQRQTMLIMQKNEIVNPNDMLNVILNNIEFIDYRKIPRLETSLQKLVELSVILLSKLTTEEFEQFITRIKDDYKYIQYLKILTIEAMPLKLAKEEVRVDIINNVYNGMMQDIMNQPINLCEPKYYAPGNILSLGIENGHNAEAFQKYIHYLLSLDINNIFKILYETISVSKNGDKFYYHISKQVQLWLMPEEDLKEIMERVKPRNHDEQVVYDIYQQYLSGNDDYLSYDVPLNLHFNEIDDEVL